MGVLRDAFSASVEVIKKWLLRKGLLICWSACGQGSTAGLWQIV